MAPLAQPALCLGTSNVTLPVANKAGFPEAFRNTSRLTYYASLFSSVEINSSFYKIPMERTVARWLQEVPDDFRFTFKLNREITHAQSMPLDADLVTRFMQTINVAKEKAGALLVQFAAGSAFNGAFLERLLGLIQRDNRGWDVCVEARHASWYADKAYRLLESYKAAVVIHDKARAVSLPTESWTPFRYFRFHGPAGNYRGTYEIDSLQDRAAEIQALLGQGQRVYAYFNNTVGGAVLDALALQELVTGRAPYNP